MRFPETIQTNALELRRLRSIHSDTFQSSFLKDQERFASSFAGTMRTLKSDPNEYFLQCDEGWLTHTRYRFGVWQGQVLVGLVGLRSVDWEGRSAELFYLVFSGFEGKGLAFESTDGLLSCAKARGLGCFWLRVLPQNERSSNLAEKLGFEKAEVLLQNYESFDGVFHDTQVYRMTLN